MALALVVLTACIACGGPASPEDVAITFLELYVFNVDQAGALELAHGLAAEKLRAEMGEVGGGRTDSFTPGQRPPISRELVDVRKESDQRILYTFRLEVRPKGGRPSYRRMLIHVERTQSQWRVADYEFWPATSPVR